MKRLALYILGERGAAPLEWRGTAVTLSALRASSSKLVVVARRDHPLDRLQAYLEASDEVASIDSDHDGLLGEWQLAQEAIVARAERDLDTYDELVVCSSRLIGPTCALQPVLERMSGRNCDFWSIHIERHGSRGDPMVPDKILTPDATFFVVRKGSFQRFLTELRTADPIGGGGAGGLPPSPMSRVLDQLAAQGAVGAYYIDPDVTTTSRPSVLEATALIEAGAPFVNKEVFSIDLVTADAEAVSGRKVLEALKRNSDFETDIVWEWLLKTLPLRHIQTHLGDLLILDERLPYASKRRWSFLPIAVFAHAYYPEMIEEFLAIVRRIPCPADVFVSTGSEVSRAAILTALASAQLPGNHEVRVVAQNRGRDMSSLFITFRDVALSDRYGLALRLHSKRTPQASVPRGRWFKEYLFDNLAASETYLCQLFDWLENEKNVGIVTPPLIHVGFATLGHAWFDNRTSFDAWAKELGLHVPIDENTPVAAYGTMFWFRPAALKRMFEHPWRWEDYHPEPHHYDGGLAHVQERLICYVAQQAGMRTVGLMTTSYASRNYVALEYKHQLLASTFPTAHFRRIMRLAREARHTFLPVSSPAGILFRIGRTYDALLMRSPRLKKALQPVVEVIWKPMRRVINRHRDG